MNDFLFFARMNDNAIVPSKRAEDSGYDIYSCFDEDSITLNPGEIKLIPSGICTAFTPNYVFFIKERSSTGAIGLSTRMGVVDSGYRGEILIALNNTSNLPIVIDKTVSKVTKEENLVRYPYSKAIAQGVLCTIPTFEAKEVSYDELQNIRSVRGESFMGASGK